MHGQGKARELNGHTMTADTIHPPPPPPLSSAVPRSGVINIIKHYNSSPVYCYTILAIAPSFALPFLPSLSPPSLSVSLSPSLSLLLFQDN